MTKLLDSSADVLPYGLQGTPFEVVFKALQTVAATVWDTDPATYRAGIAWGWYLQNAPELLEGFPDLVRAALVSASAPYLRDDQTVYELLAYLSDWQVYRPTFSALEGLYTHFGVTAEILPVSDAVSQAVCPSDGAFYVKIAAYDPTRPFSLSEAAFLADRASPMGRGATAYYAVDEQVALYAGTGTAGVVFVAHVTEPAAAVISSRKIEYVDTDGVLMKYVDIGVEDVISATPGSLGGSATDISPEIEWVEE